MSLPLNPLPKPRRIMTANLPLPSALKDCKAEPAAEVVCEELTPILGSRYLVLNHKTVPTCNHGQLKDVAPEEVPPPGVVMPNGANAQVFDIPPHTKIPIHRTTSTDYIVFQIGEVILTTYSEAHDTESTTGALKETICRPGDILVQRGTLHGWENRTDEWARVLTFILASEPTSTEIEGSEGRYELADVVF